MKQGEYIKNFLNQKKAASFSGAVKLSFEEGKLASVVEANHLELPMSKSFSQDTTEKLITMASEKAFSGALAFFFNRGSVEYYSYARTYKGQALEGLMKGR